ncbi:MAG: hypothetical protein KA260_09280 [Burkholderiales bacterium]|nr:hypothetical protein [Burkholderiales bacterium]
MKALIASLLGAASLAVCAAPTDLDTTFGGTGKVITDINDSDFATSVAVQTDGKIVVAGYCVNGAVICVARYSATGVLDATFNTTGTVQTPVNSGTDRALGLAIQGDGKIVVSGACERPLVGFPGAFTIEFCVVRYTTTGALDTSFNGTGIVQVAAGGNGQDLGSAVAIQIDNKIVVAGTCANFSSTAAEICIVRFTSAGAFDTTFNATGKVVTALGSGLNTGQTVVVQPDGKIVAAGNCDSVAIQEFCVLRYTTNGVSDATFNATGILRFPIGSGSALANSLTLQADGKYVLAGRCSNGANLDFCMARVTAAGVLDSTFNSTGKVITAMGGAEDVAHKVAIDADGKIVLAGYCEVSTNNFFPCMARYTTVGLLDTTFNTTGKFIASANPGPNAQRGMTLQADGKIILVGSTGNNFLVSRYEGSPTPPCRLDIDGDGLVLATTDSLVHARIAIGLSGNAVTNGIGFPVAATRKTWTAIRAYLVASCAMILPP